MDANDSSDIIRVVATILIRGLDDSVKAKLRTRAASHGRSMEAEAREILREGLRPKPKRRLNFAESLRQYVAPFGGIELKIPPREPIRKPPDFS